MNNPMMGDDIPKPIYTNAVEFNVPREIEVGIDPKNYAIEPIIRRQWGMPNKNTYKVKPIADFIGKEAAKGGIIIEPFAGESGLDSIKNDINPGLNTFFSTDGLSFLEQLPDNFADLVVYNPPNAIKSAKAYDVYGTANFSVLPSNKKYWSLCKWHIARITKLGGRCICLGWNSGGIGKNKGYLLTEVLMVPHGGDRNDTICTLEYKTCKYTDMERWQLDPEDI